jgi:hypothetical protein
MARGRLRWLVSGAAAALAVACVEPGATRIVGPDGTRMLHVHCGDEQVACFQIAGELCPHGYYLSPIFEPRDGNFLVRCKAPVEAVTVASAPQPAAAAVAAAPQQHSPFVERSAAPSSSAEQPWPPSEVARPTEPWPAASSSAAQGAIGDVDLGY